MIKLGRAALFTLTIVLWLTPPPATAQSADDTMPMRTPDGQPDVSGIFTFRTITPFQRPEQFAGQETLNPEEAAAFESSERTRQNRDLFDPEKGSGGYAPRSEGGVLSYNEFWYERGIELTSDKRTALIIDPADGRLPPRTAAAIEAAAVRRAYVEEHRYDSYENRSTGQQSKPEGRPVPHGFQRRSTNAVKCLQQQCNDLPVSRLCSHPQRDGPQRPDYSHRRHTPASFFAV